jgi:hypothetical protein
VGIERTIALRDRAKAALRGGWFLEPSPVSSDLPASQAYDARTASSIDVPTRFFDATRMAFTFGGGLRIEDVTLDGFAQVHLLLPRDMNLAAGGPNGPTRASISGTAMAGGLVLGVAF